MSDAIREKADDLIKVIAQEADKWLRAWCETIPDNTRYKEFEHKNSLMEHIVGTAAYKELAASLRPSREDIADYLDRRVNIEPENICGEEASYINYAIEELRR